MIGRLNQPKACGLDGMIGNATTFIFIVFWYQSQYISNPPPSYIHPRKSIWSMPKGPAGVAANSVAAEFLPCQ